MITYHMITLRASVLAWKEGRPHHTIRAGYKWRPQNQKFTKNCMGNCGSHMVLGINVDSLVPAACWSLLPGLSCLHLAPTSFFLAALCGLLLSSETWDGAAQVGQRQGHLAAQGLVTSINEVMVNSPLHLPILPLLGFSDYFWFMV